MRLSSLAIAGLLASGPAQAETGAESNPGLPPVAGRSITLGFTGQGGKVAGVPLGSVGPSVELALGHRRLQSFVEGSVSLVWLGVDTDRSTGVQWRGGVGVRWLARSFELGRRASLDMHLEAVGGMSRFQLEDRARFSRPDLGIGVGYQLRAFRERANRPARQVAFRVSARAVFARSDSRDEQIACRGTCEMSPATDSGLMMVLGGQF